MIKPLPLGVVASFGGWLGAGVVVKELYSVTTFCWFWVPKPKSPMPMKNERFCQITLLYSSGSEYLLQDPFVPCPSGQEKPEGGRFACSMGLFVTLTNPATCGHDCVPLFAVQLVSGALARGANSEPERTPDAAVESLETIVLLTMFTANASNNDTPAPSQPATLLVMMLLVTLTEFQAQSNRLEHANCPPGKLITSVPLTCCNRRPQPLPLS